MLIKKTSFLPYKLLFLDNEFQKPKLLRLEPLNFLLALNDETKGWELAWTIANERPFLVKFCLAHILQAQSQKPRESCSNPQVNLFPYLHGICKIFIWPLEIIHGTNNLLPR